MHHKSSRLAVALLALTAALAGCTAPAPSAPPQAAPATTAAAAKGEAVATTAASAPKAWLSARSR